jgi:hypothetical protein
MPVLCTETCSVRDVELRKKDHSTVRPKSVSEWSMLLGHEVGRAQQRVDFSNYLDGLYGYAMVLSRNSAEAEDLVQETCLRALRGVDGLRLMSSNSILTKVESLNQPTKGKIPTRPMSTKSSASNYELRFSSFPWNSARSSFCANTKSFPIRKLLPFSSVRPVPSCRDWQERAPNSGSCLLPH